MPTTTVPINGERLRLVRKSRKRPDGRAWTQEDLSQHSGVSRPYISEIEKGRKTPSKRVAMILAQTLQVGLDELVS